MSRSPLVALLSEAKLRSGRDWPTIDRQARISKSTREAWLNGRVAKPNAYDLHRLAHALGIDGRELHAALLELPPPPADARPALGRLLSAGKQRRGQTWLEIEDALDLRRATREAWMNGHTTRLPLPDVVRLAEHLGITGQEVVDAVLRNELPDWVHRRWY